MKFESLFFVANPMFGRIPMNNQVLVAQSFPSEKKVEVIEDTLWPWSWTGTNV